MALPTVILPGYLAGAEDYRELERTLQRFGVAAVTVPLRWHDWVPTLGGRSVRPILQRIDATVKQVLQQSGSPKVNLVGHSAAGWLARIYMGEQPYCIDPSGRDSCVWHARPSIASLITLGTPHTSLERWTQRNLEFVNLTYPGAFYSDVRYICIAGKAIFGDRWKSWLAFSSYRLTCGEGNTWGDGITPIVSAHLKGAENLIVEGAKHSPKTGSWYGSEHLIDQWVSHLT